jgi:hypothetical protein
MPAPGALLLLTMPLGFACGRSSGSLGWGPGIARLVPSLLLPWLPLTPPPPPLLLLLHTRCSTALPYVVLLILPHPAARYMAEPSEHHLLQLQLLL